MEKKFPLTPSSKKEKAILSEKKDRLYEERKQMKASVKVLKDALALFGERKITQEQKMELN